MIGAYTSPDYVFDGTSAPYVPSAPTNPLQYYGQTKRDGELAILGVEGAKAVVLRVPVLCVACWPVCTRPKNSPMVYGYRYGPTRQNSDSAVNILVDIVRDQSGKQYKMDHYATRYPTNVLDIASFLVQLSGRSHRT
jgi:S-adenosylmethionine synthetase